MNMSVDYSDMMVNRVREFGMELKRVCSEGHVVRLENIQTSDRNLCKGVEIFLDTKTSKSQVRHIVAYIVKRYNFDAYFYTKSHSIKVWYRNAK